MSIIDPLKKDKSDYEEIIKKIRTESSVGIDAQLTHAIIITFLQQISERLDRIEKAVFQRKP